ncbi:unnamed protein product [Moneuplotes crassus]|uniref:Glutathione transferase n=1 Tax=Euplotes crassus TaxID=5936 RepID=A0AAD1XSU3_EUPCR|nr:unnamed protein product [Moneuplotes crassus]
MKLYYFDLYGRGEAIRLLLTHAKAEWTEQRISFEEWPEVKTSNKGIKFGQLPVLEKDGKFYAQGGAILRYLGGNHGYYPEDVEERFRVDEITDLIASDFSPKIGEAVFGAKTEEEKKDSIGKLVEEHFPKFFGFLEEQLTSNSSQDFLVGDSYTIADFVLLSSYIAHINHPHRKDQVSPLLDSYPTLKAYFAARTADLKDYLDSLPECFL